MDDKKRDSLLADIDIFRGYSPERLEKLIKGHADNRNYLLDLSEVDEKFALEVDKVLGPQWKEDLKREANKNNIKGEADMDEYNFKDIQDELIEQNKEKYEEHKKNQQEEKKRLEAEKAKKQRQLKIENAKKQEEANRTEKRRKKEENYNDIWQNAINELENIEDPSGFAAYAVEEGLIDPEIEQIRKASWGEMLSEQRGASLTYEFLKQGKLNEKSIKGESEKEEQEKEESEKSVGESSFKYIPKGVRNRVSNAFQAFSRKGQGIVSFLRALFGDMPQIDWEAARENLRNARPIGKIEQKGPGLKDKLVAKFKEKVQQAKGKLFQNGLTNEDKLYQQSVMQEMKEHGIEFSINPDKKMTKPNIVLGDSEKNTEALLYEFQDENLSKMKGVKDVAREVQGYKSYFAVIKDENNQIRFEKFYADLSKMEPGSENKDTKHVLELLNDKEGMRAVRNDNNVMGTFERDKNDEPIITFLERDEGVSKYIETFKQDKKQQEPQAKEQNQKTGPER